MRSPDLLEARRRSEACLKHGGFLKLGVPFWRPHKEGCSILGSILEPPYFGKLPKVPSPMCCGSCLSLECEDLGFSGLFAFAVEA